MESLPRNTEVLRASRPPEPLIASLAVTRQPGALALGVLAGGIAGGLAGLAGGLVFIKSPVAVVVVPVVAVALIAMWSAAIGSIALVCSAQDERISILVALRRVALRGPAVIGTVLPVYVLVAGLVSLQFGLFALMRGQAAGPDRPVVLIALVFVALFMIDVLVLAAANIAQWLLVPYVVSDELGPMRSYAQARLAFWDRPGATAGVMVGVLGVAGAASMALIGLVMMALVMVSATQFLGGGELALLSLPLPLFQDIFTTITVADLEGVVIIVTGVGVVLGGAIGFGQTFGAAGGASLKNAHEAEHGGFQN